MRTRFTQNNLSDRARSVSPTIIKDFFEKLSKIYSYNVIEPENIFNADETGFQCGAGQIKIVCNKSLRNAHSIAGNNQRQSYTILYCCSASGEFLPPLILFKGKNLYREWCYDGPEVAQYSTRHS